jgi:hypothetical protein
MSFTLSVFDLFASVIPGSLYLATFVYVSVRLGWLDLGSIQQLDTLIIIIGAALGSYLLGHIAYPVGLFIDRTLPLWIKGMPEMRRGFLARVPAPKAQLLLRADLFFFLLAAAEVRAREVALEVSRLRSHGIMLRNAAPALILASAVSVFELLVGSNPGFAAGCAALFLLIAVAAVRHGRTVTTWAVSKTLEIAFWALDMDELTNAGMPADHKTRERDVQPTQSADTERQPPHP